MVEPFVPDRNLFPFESRWFNSDVGQIHYVDEGSGQPILMLHGNPTWSFLYRGIIIRLTHPPRPLGRQRLICHE